MTIHLTRRAFVPVLVLAAVGAGSLSRRALAAGSGIQAEAIAADLTLFTGAGGNVLVNEGPASLALIDGGAAPHSAALLQALDGHYGGKPVAALVNTHWHPEQTGSNDALGAAGVPIIAHENTRRWMSRRIEQGWGGPVFEPRAAVALPTRTFYLDDTLQHGGTDIALHHTPRAHTDGDIHAVFAQAKVIAAGGIAYAGRYPVLDTASNGWIGELLDATRTLLARADDSTLIVPADGPVLRRAQLVAQEHMLATILQRFQQLSARGLGADDMLREGIAAEFVADWGAPDEFILTAWDGLWDHMRGLGAF